MKPKTTDPVILDQRMFHVSIVGRPVDVTDYEGICLWDAPTVDTMKKIAAMRVGDRVEQLRREDFPPFEVERAK